MRVLFILPHPIEGPSSRFRVYQYLPYLTSMGVEAVVRPFLSSAHIHRLYSDGHLSLKTGLTLSGLAGRAGDIVRASRCDVVFILREAFALGPPAIELLLGHASGRMVFDFDDAIYTPSLAYTNPIDRLRDWSKTARLIGRADTTIAGSRYLATYSRQHAGPANRIEILPTVVDTDVYVPRQVHDGDTVTLGWIGTPRGSSYVAQLKPVFERLSARHPHVRYVFVGCAPFERGHLPIEFRDWSLAREVDDIASFDIGIMPLTDDEETRGKCGFKLIQYMSCGVAAVASPVGANTDILRPGETGLFAETEERWLEALTLLVEDAGLRRAFAAKGRMLAREQWSLQVMAPRMLAILQEVAARR